MIKLDTEKSEMHHMSSIIFLWMQFEVEMSVIL